MGSEQVYLDNSAIIEQAIGAICRRQHLSFEDAEDFAGSVRLHLVENDYAVLRKFQGRSSLRVYLFAVITHLAQDWRNAKWGKWRSSAEARRQGPLAVHLERLIVRDRLPFEQALEALRTDFRVTEPRRRLEEIAARLPTRAGRRFVAESALDAYPVTDEDLEQAMHRHDSAGVARTASAVLSDALGALPSQDRLILRMRFHDDHSVADIARTLHVDQKALYRRVDRLLQALRSALTEAGVTAEDAADVLRDRGFDALLQEEAEIADGVRPLQSAGDTPGRSTRFP